MKTQKIKRARAYCSNHGDWVDGTVYLLDAKVICEECYIKVFPKFKEANEKR